MCVIKFTVFTPTYNRAYLLDNLYKSLKKQTYNNFEWLIVDDGSTDNTEELVQTWKANEKEFAIRYFKTKNGGKHRAINYALELAEGEWFFTVDSDDYLTEDALKKMDYWTQQIENSAKIIGVTANKGTSRTYTPNNTFEEDYIEKTLIEMETYMQKGKKVLAGERAMCFRTNIHRQYKYPEFVDEKFMTEAVVYNRMAADGYRVRFYNDIIWIYEYRADGLTTAGNKLFLNNPHGYGLWLREKAIFQKATFIERLKLYYSFTCELIELYPIELIADCIGTKKLVIGLAKIVHMIRKKIKGKRHQRETIKSNQCKP